MILYICSFDSSFVSSISFAQVSQTHDYGKAFKRQRKKLHLVKTMSFPNTAIILYQQYSREEAIIEISKEFSKPKKSFLHPKF